MLKFFDTEEEDCHNGKDKNDDGETITKPEILKARKAIQILKISAYFYNLENAEIFETDSADKEELCNKTQVYIKDFFF